MLKNIFLPDVISNYYLFGQRLIGLDIKRTKIIAAQIYASGKQFTIEKIVQENINLDEKEIDHNTQMALTNIFSKLEKANQIRVGLPNSLATFKDLHVPFLQADKISMILPMEVESSIPFSIDNAVIDFIILNQNKPKKNSDILTVITQKKNINYLINLFLEANKKLSNISVDIIAIYGFLKNNFKKNGAVLLIDINFSSTTIAILSDNDDSISALSNIRTITKGFNLLIGKIAKNENTTKNIALQNLQRYGDTKYSKEILNFISDICADIAFTTAQIKNISLSKAIIINSELNLSLNKEISDNLKIDTQYVDIGSILKAFNIKKKSSLQIENSYFSSLSIAITTKTDYNFNLLEKHIDADAKKLLGAQLITSIILILGILVSLFLFSFFRNRSLDRELNKSRSELVLAIKKTFDITDPILLRNATKLVNSIKNKVDEDESLWFSFSKKIRFSFLKYLQELSTLIDTSKLGLKLSKLSLSEGSINLSGNVPDFNALKDLEESLNKSQLFSKVSVPQETEFNITLTFKKNDNDKDM